MSQVQSRVKVLKKRAKGNWSLKCVNDMFNYYSHSAVKDKGEWDAFIAEHGDHAFVIIGHDSLTDSAGDRHDVCAYTSGKIFNNIKRAHTAFGKYQCVIIDGKQKVSVMTSITLIITKYPKNTNSPQVVSSCLPFLPCVPPTTTPPRTLRSKLAGG